MDHLHEYEMSTVFLWQNHICKDFVGQYLIMMFADVTQL